MIKVANIAKFYIGSKNQIDALNMFDALLSGSDLTKDDQPWVKLWRSPDRRKINQAGLDLIKEFEGCVLTAYDDGVGVLTIGYGHTKNVYPNQTINYETAIAFLEEDLEVFERGVDSLVKVSITDNQFSALVSFAFNVGLGALDSSTLLNLLNQGRADEAAAQFMRWTNANGVSLDGLVCRREAETRLFRS